MNLIFATNNQNKVLEVAKQLSVIEIKSLKDINCLVDIPETGNNLEENALIKAKYVYENYNLNCFADDTGLEVDALNGAPGVYSARYGGQEKSAELNMAKLLKELEGIENRKAQFRTVIVLILDGTKHLFEGIVKGEIIDKKQGDGGFGYDPIFIPEGYNKTFAEFTMEEKNAISHRGRAVKKLVAFLNKHTP